MTRESFWVEDQALTAVQFSLSVLRRIPRGGNGATCSRHAVLGHPRHHTGIATATKRWANHPLDCTQAGPIRLSFGGLVSRVRIWD